MKPAIPRFLVLFLFAVLSAPWTRGATTEALVVITADQHSAYDKLPQLVRQIDRLRTDNPDVPLAILINGDAFEQGNALARRTQGALDFALFAALVQRAPTVLNLGNHEPDLMGMADVVARLQAAGVQVVSGNLRDRSTGKPFAPASTELTLGAHRLTIVGVATDALNTYRAAVRPELDVSDPVAWASRELPALFADASLPVLLSHAGLRADRQLLDKVPDGTLFSGAHDHARFLHHEGRTFYFHSGCWLDGVSVARLERTNPTELRWVVDYVPLRASDPADPELAQLVGRTMTQHLTSEETEVVGHSAHALSPPEAARFAVAAARQAANADVAVIGGTTFGGGIPAGPLTRYVFDGWVRFDGPLFAGEISGRDLAVLMRRANQGPATPFAERSGENLVLVGPDSIDEQKTYRLVTTDWIAKIPTRYLGPTAPQLTELPHLRLKPITQKALR